MPSAVHVAEIAHEANRSYSETELGLWSVKPWHSVKQDDRDTFASVIETVAADTTVEQFFVALVSSWKSEAGLDDPLPEFAQLGDARKLQMRLMLAIIKTLRGF